MQRKELLFLIAIFITGILYRLWIVRLVPQPFIGDQPEYYSFIRGILKYGLHADTIFLYGYPMLIAPLVYAFGFISKPWIVFHAIVDSTTGILVYFIARKLFERSPRSIAWIALVLYIMNPYTSAYVGVLLTEVVAIFLMTLICVMFLRFLIDKKFLYLMLLAFLLGYLPQVRPSFVFLTIMLIVYTGILSWRYLKKNKIKVVAIFILYSLPFTYNVVTNIVHYRQIAPLMVDNFFIREVYVSLLVDRGTPSFATRQINWPPEVYEAWNEFSNPSTPSDRRSMERKFMRTFFNRIQENPRHFVYSRVKKLLYVWEKHFLYQFIQGRENAHIDFAVYWGNIVLFMSGLVGFFASIRSAVRHKQLVSFRFSIFTATIILYITIAHIFSVTEERFSLPGYPLVILYASYMLSTIWTFCLRFQKLRRKNWISPPTTGGA